MSLCGNFRHRALRLVCLSAMLYASLGVALALAGGCSALGLAAHALPPPKVEPVYENLAGRSIAVMVWADQGIRIDWQPIQLDLTSAIQQKLFDAAASGKVDHVGGSTFPLRPESVVRYQRDYPHIEGLLITDVAPSLKVDRLIYVELEDFSTRSPGAIQLFKGHAEATLKIVEVTGNTAQIAYEESAITAIFPERGPDEGVPDADDYTIYRGTVDALAVQIVQRLIPYQPEEW
jgi:hypothetical protein